MSKGVNLSAPIAPEAPQMTRGVQALILEGYALPQSQKLLQSLKELLLLEVPKETLAGQKDSHVFPRKGRIDAFHKFFLTIFILGEALGQYNVIK